MAKLLTLMEVVSYAKDEDNDLFIQLRHPVSHQEHHAMVSVTLYSTHRKNSEVRMGICEHGTFMNDLKLPSNYAIIFNKPFQSSYGETVRFFDGIPADEDLKLPFSPIIEDNKFDLTSYLT